MSATGKTNPVSSSPTRPGRGEAPRHRRKRDRGVEANSRLIGTTGLLLLVMLAAEGLTIVSIRGLLSWHVAIGLALLPPIAVKLAATFWRFARYYLNDVRYRQAGPPTPLVRALGPVVVLTTVALFGTGIAAWLEGPSARQMITFHKISFFLWFAAMAAHVLVHTLRATRLTLADMTSRAQRAAATHAGLRQALVAASLVVGIVLGAAYFHLPAGWTDWVHRSAFR